MKPFNLLHILLTFFCVFLYYIHINLINQNSLEGFKDSSDTVPTVSFPFKNLFDQNGKKLNIILISAPFRNEEHEKLYLKYKNLPNIDFMGISSYSEFPSKLSNPYENRYHEQKNHDYQAMVKTWLHCFRNPDQYLRPDIPKLFLSESDLKDYNIHKPDPSIKKEYDFIYVCLKDNDKCTPGWQSHNRNWDLAKKCLEIMCEKYGLKGCLVGRQNCKFTSKCNGIVKVLPFLKYHEFQKELQKAKFLFVPNVSDASPRVIVEAMCYNLCLLVNYNIVGGWKYVNQETGEFFNNEHDISSAIDKLLKNMDKYTPRNHFINNYGKEKSGVLLAKFIKDNYPNVQPKALTYATITI
jgi:hypothetical protein